MKVVLTFLAYAVIFVNVVDVDARLDASLRLSEDVQPFFRPRPRRGGAQLHDRPLRPPREEYPPGHDKNISGTEAKPETSITAPKQEESSPPSHSVAASPKFHLARWIAFFNVLLFALRPDPDVSWPARLPRILWEFALWFNFRQTRTDNVPSMFYAWLSFLTGSTGLIDIFVWAPIYGTFVSFEHCEGGWLQPKICRADPIKGYSRLLVAIQSVVGGMIYLQAAFQSAHVLHLRNVEQRRKEQELQRRLNYYQYHYPPRSALPPPHYRR